jgi:predicted PurR-regulated permease PerM
MKRENFLTILFFLIAALSIYLFYKIMAMFLIPIFWGGILCIVFFPLYRKMRKRIKSHNLAAFAILVLIFFIIIGPAIYLLLSLVGEASDAFVWIDNAYQSGQLKAYVTKIMPFINTIQSKLMSYPELASLDFESIIKNIFSTVTAAIGTKATAVIANIPKTVFQFFLTMFAMFFFFRDGETLMQLLRRLTPLTPEQSGTTYAYLKEVIEGTMYGGVVMALIQGTLGGLLFAVMGITSPVFWGAVMGFLSFLPVLGPFIIYIPAGVILILAGSPIKGIITLVFGILVISQIDNFVRPLLFRGKTKMHTMLMFFSIMGGMALFGLVGIVLGPFIAAVFMSILKIFETKLRPETTSAELS